MRHAFVRVVLALASSAALAACGDGTTSPSPALGLYALQSIGGQPLPHVLFANGNDTTSLIGESLAFSTGGHLTRTTTMRSVVNGGPAQVTSSTAAYTYTVDGSLVVLQLVCPAGAPCVAPERGTITGLELDLSNGSGAPVWRYARVTLAPNLQ